MPRRIGPTAGSVQRGNTSPIPARLLLPCQRLRALASVCLPCVLTSNIPQASSKEASASRSPTRVSTGLLAAKPPSGGPRAWPWAASSVWFSPSCLRTSDAVSPRRRPHSGEAQSPYTARLWELLGGPEALLHRGLQGPKVQVLVTRVSWYLCRHTTGPSDLISKSLTQNLNHTRG